MQHSALHSQPVGIHGCLRYTGISFLCCKHYSWTMLFKFFSFVVISKWIIWASVITAHVHCSPCLLVCVCLCMCVCIPGCLILRWTFFSRKQTAGCGEDPQLFTLEVITPGKAIRSIHFSSSKGHSHRKAVTSCFCCSNSQQPTAT